MISIPPQALRLEFCECRTSNNFKDNWKHIKTAPYTIVAQVLNGTYEIECNQQHEMVHEGEAFLTPANSEMTIIHHFGPKPDRNYMESQWLHFHVTVFDTIDVTALFDMPLKISKQHQDRVNTCIQRALSASGSNALVNSIQLNALAFDVLELIAMISSPNTVRFRQLETSTRFVPVFDYIKKHLGAPVSVSDMAKQAGMSLAHFHHVFKESLGCSPMNYLKKVRLEQAGLYLLNSDHTLAEIADLTGFSNQFHLCREFKKVNGSAPSHYREQNRW